MSVTRQSRQRACFLLLVSLALAFQLNQSQSANAQQATVPAVPVLNHVVDAQGMPTTDLNAPLFRAGTNPLVPLTRSNGDPITLDDFNNATGQVHIAARPGGGTEVNVDVQGLFPGETYTVWGSYFQEPGFLTGPRVGFGAVSAIGDGSDVSAVADVNGAISLGLVLLEGPMTAQGIAPAYAPISPLVASNGDLQPHTGFNVAIAYHFNNPPDGPFLAPPPNANFALQAVSSFAAVPEPSSVALAILLVVGCGVFVRRRRTT
jgi:hypothetical protein